VTTFLATQTHNYLFYYRMYEKKMRHLFSFISLSVLMLLFSVLFGQIQDVLPFILHTGTGLGDKRFLRYRQNRFDVAFLNNMVGFRK
jgi:uncharacterized membrane protein